MIWNRDIKWDHINLNFETQLRTNLQSSTKESKWYCILKTQLPYRIFLYQWITYGSYLKGGDNTAIGSLSLLLLNKIGKSGNVEIEKGIFKLVESIKKWRLYFSHMYGRKCILFRYFRRITCNQIRMTFYVIKWV